MAITRRSLFGIPPNPTQGSTNTTRLVPLTQGMRPDVPWPLRTPGSAASMANLWPLDGMVRPRSRLSSLNTIRSLTGIIGLAEQTPASAALGTNIWMSTSTRHGVLDVASVGSISVASFVSAFGFGVAPTLTVSHWEYAQIFFPNLGSAGDNGLVAAGQSSAGASVDTLVAIYRNSGGVGAPRFSYLTTAPVAGAVTVFDSYLVAFNAGGFPTRVQWCQRGSVSNWTGEGSGLEDLLEMRGRGTAIKSLGNQRMVLFTDREIWYGISATYPFQFTFYPLDPNVGCLAPATIQEVDDGFLFLGTDGALRLLPRDGGLSQIVFPTLRKVLRQSAAYSNGWGVYDPKQRLYHLFPGPTTAGVNGVVVNIDTGEWGIQSFGTVTNDTPQVGLAVDNPPSGANEGLYFANSVGTLFSTSSLLAKDSHGTTVTGVWRSSAIAQELAGNWKQVNKVALDYVATSKSTVTVKFSQDGGNNFEATGRVMSLTSAPVAGRVELDVYIGGASPAMELTSESTGMEMHRLDVAMNIGGRK